MRIVHAALLSGALFFGVLVCLRVGWALGPARLRASGEDSIAGLGALEGAIFALMGLLVAFTFTGAAERFEHRRDLITQEVNAIGTAWLRLDLLDADARSEIRTLFQQYLDARIDTYANVRDSGAVASAMARSTEAQNAIWARLATAARQDPTPRIATAVLPPVNEMFDLANTRTLATRQHPPIIIYFMLGLLVLVLRTRGASLHTQLPPGHLCQDGAVISSKAPVPALNAPETSAPVAADASYAWLGEKSPSRSRKSRADVA
jgi:hypothetical protein